MTTSTPSLDALKPLRAALAQARKAEKAAYEAQQTHYKTVIAPEIEAKFPRWDASPIGSEAAMDRNDAWSLLANGARSGDEATEWTKKALATLAEYGVADTLVAASTGFHDAWREAKRRTEAALAALHAALLAIAAEEPAYTGRGPVGCIAQTPDGAWHIVKLTTTNDYQFAAGKQINGVWRVGSAHSRRDLVPEGCIPVPTKTTKPIR